MSRPAHCASRLIAAIALACATLDATTPARAQTTPCGAIFETALAGGVAQAEQHLQKQWAMIDGTWVAAYRLEGEKVNPLDPSRLREQRPAPGTDRPAAGAAPQPKPLPPVTGFASARDVRCNASAASAKADVLLVYTAAGVRFQEGKGPWSDVLPRAVIAAIQLRRAGAGWTLVDRTAEAGVMPPDARRSPPEDALARKLATQPWSAARKRQRVRRG